MLEIESANCGQENYRHGNPVSVEQAAERRVGAAELCRFLSEYAAKLLSSGTTTIRTEKNVVRIAESYGALADFAVLPNEIMLTLWDGKHEHSYTVNCKISETSLNFDAITRLSALSWKISDN